MSRVLMYSAWIWYFGWMIVDLSSDNDHHWMFPVAWLGALVLILLSVRAMRKTPKHTSPLPGEGRCE